MTQINKLNMEELLDDNQVNVHEKFNSTSWLSKKEHVDVFFQANTYYRRNLHRFAKDYFGFQLYWYQMIILYLMGISNCICLIASRAAAKSYIIAIYACCKAVLYPNSQIVLTSGTKGQSRLIVSKKIQGELMPKSETLRREIKKIVTSNQEIEVRFKNDSAIFTVTCSDNARGNRCTVDIGEEAREINKSIMDRVISPFQIVRQTPFIQLPDYATGGFAEEPTEILISSSIPETHWLYKSAKDIAKGMLNGDGSFFMALDYAISLKHGIRTKKQLAREKRKVDPVTWMMEYENLVLRSNANAYFPYDLIKPNKVLKKAFYPHDLEYLSAKEKYKSVLPKQAGEIRVVSCDIAAIDRTENDNSVYSCLRLFPECTKTVDGKENDDYHIQVPYIEAFKGREIKKQAIRIRQLYNDFNADFIVLDVRNVGIAVYDFLARVLYDDERDVEYAPFKAMNDNVIANRIYNPNALDKIFCVNATPKLNSEMAVTLRSAFIEQRIDLLVDKDDGVDELTKHNQDYNERYNDISVQVFYEHPYIETMLFTSELINLLYEKLDSTGLIRIFEHGKDMKDRYSSVAMGVLFANKLALDLLSKDDDDEKYANYSCVSTFSF